MVFSKKTLNIALIVIVAGLFAYFFIIKGETKSETNVTSEDSGEQAKKPAETPLPIKAATAQRGDLIIKLKSPGEAVTNRRILMKNEVSGIIKSLNVKESQHVKKGDLLVELDDSSYKLDLQTSEANRLKVLSELLLEQKYGEIEVPSSGSTNFQAQKAKEIFEAAGQQFRKGLISQEEFESASKTYEFALIESGEKKEEIRAATKDLTQMEIRVKKARIDLEKTKIRAPFSGIITEIQVSPQEHLTSGRELFILVNIDRVKVNAKVLESEIGKMKVGREVDLRFSAYPGKVFKGKVEAISPIIDPDDKTCNVIIDVANPEESIKPGMHAEVEIAAEIHKDKLLVPQAALLTRGGRKLVFVVQEGVAKWRYVKVGLENDEYAEILESVEEGDSVIIEGHFTLAHDARVRIVQ